MKKKEFRRYESRFKLSVLRDIYGRQSFHLTQKAYLCQKKSSTR